MFFLFLSPPMTSWDFTTIRNYTIGGAVTHLLNSTAYKDPKAVNTRIIVLNLKTGGKWINIHIIFLKIIIFFWLNT